MEFVPHPHDQQHDDLAGKYVLVAVGPTGTVASQEVTVSFAQSAAKTEASAK